MSDHTTHCNCAVENVSLRSRVSFWVERSGKLADSLAYWLPDELSVHKSDMKRFYADLELVKESKGQTEGR